jgi:hypothetical protein
MTNTTTETTATPKVRGRRPERVTRKFKGWEIQPEGTNFWAIVKGEERHDGYLTVVAAQKAITQLALAGV